VKKGKFLKDSETYFSFMFCVFMDLKKIKNFLLKLKTRFLCLYLQVNIFNI